MSGKIGLLIITLLLLLVVFLVLHHSPKTGGQQPKKIRQVAFGAWTQGLFDPSDKTLHPEKLRQFEKLIDKKVSIAHYYAGWEILDNPDLLTQFKDLRAQGWEPMLNVNPYYFDGCPAVDIPIYRAIAAGKCDEFLRKAGKNLSYVNKPFYLVFAWEMNNKQNEWSIPYSQSTPQEFIAAWRHIHTIFKEEKAVSVVWVFCPNVPDDKSISYSAIYPGDNYVDWIGLDGYNWGDTQSWSSWMSFSDVFRASYDNLTSIAPSKPLIIAEVNTTDQGGDKGSWYKDMLTKEIPNNFPKIKAVVIFNEDRTQQEDANWLIDATPDSLQAFKSAVQSPMYK